MGFHPEKILFAASAALSRFINREKAVPSSFRRILIIKLDEIGDVVTAMHTWQLLKKYHPGAQITLWCKPFIKGLVENDPALGCIIHDKKELVGWYDLVIDLRGNWYTLWYALWHRPLLRLDRGTVRYRNRGDQKNETETNFEIVKPALPYTAVLEYPKIHLSVTNREKAQRFLNENHITRYAVFHMGARSSLRRWPGERFAQVAAYLKQQKGLDIIFSGSSDENESIDLVRGSVSFPTHRFTNGYSLSDFAALVSGAAIFIGNESGPLHIATTFQVPLIGLFGPGVKTVFYPYGPKSRVIHHILECNPCDQVHCVKPGNPCIEHITVAEVVLEIENLL